jgi:D-erythrose 4-phosphate dehydrogenase
VVAINELAPPTSIAHLLEFDSTHGRFTFPITVTEERMSVDGRSIYLLAERRIDQLPWDNLGIDIVLECTGICNTFEDAMLHVRAGADKVLLSNPADQFVENTIVYGVNQDSLTSKQRIVSNGSCTSNCIVPVIKALDDAFTVESGTITTIHSAMNDQHVVDGYQDDLRLARTSSQSIIPVDTKLARGIERILPHLAERFEAIAVRVPTVNVTAMDLSVTVSNKVTVAQVNQALKQASENQFENLVGYTQMPLVSVDFIHDSRSAIIDGTQTRVSHKHLIKVLAWCDNEWGYANRMLDTTIAMMQAE